jgi:hypothetical protein
VKKAPLWSTLEKIVLSSSFQGGVGLSKYVMKLEPPQAPDWEEREMAQAVGQVLPQKQLLPVEKEGRCCPAKRTRAALSLLLEAKLIKMSQHLQKRRC